VQTRFGTDRRTLARRHGSFQIATGLWPVLHMPSFEAVTGTKRDRWLVNTVGLLLVAIGVAQISARDTGDAERLGVGSAAALAAIDLWYAARRRISAVYLLDACAQAGWIAAWMRARRSEASLGADGTGPRADASSIARDARHDRSIVPSSGSVPIGARGSPGPLGGT
jgi:hypothetical protein